MEKIFITAIDSFTGTHLASSLKKAGYQVVGTTYHTCNLTNKHEIKKALQEEKPHFIIHLAGISYPAHGDESDFYLVNTIGTTNLLDAIVALGLEPKKVILASSATVYGNQGLEVLDETLCPKPSNHYGASKFAMETLASGYFEKFPILVTRPFNYTGIGQAEHFLIPKIVKHYKEKKETISLGNLDVSREFNDISFVCEIYKRLLECEAKGEVINICSGQEISLLKIIHNMDEIAGYKMKVSIDTNLIRQDEIKVLKGSPKKMFDKIGEVKQKEFKELLKQMFDEK